MEQAHHPFVQAIPYAGAIRRAGNIAHHDVDSGGAWAHFHRRRRARMAQAALLGSTLPFRLSHAGILFGLLDHGFVDALDEAVGVSIRGYAEPDLIPHPLTAAREVEVLALDGETVQECNAPSGRIALVGPVAGFEQGGTEQADFDRLAGHAVNLHTVANMDAALTHQHEPAEEGDDEVLHDNRKAGSGKAKDGGHLARDAEDDQEDEHHPGELYAQLEDDPQRVRAAPVERGPLDVMYGESVQQQNADEDEGNQSEGLQDEMKHDAMLQRQLRGPLLINAGELLVGFDAVVVDGQKLAPRAAVLERRKGDGLVRGAGLRASGLGGAGHLLGRLMFRGERGGVRVGLFHGLLD